MLRRVALPSYASFVAVAGFLGGLVGFVIPLAAPQTALSQSTACGNPQVFCSRQLSPSCTQRYGAGTIAAESSGEPAGDCKAEFAAYRDCLALIAAQCGKKPETQPATQPTTAPGGGGNPSMMMTIWAEVKDSGDPAVLRAFAKEYPGTTLATLATRRAERLEDAATAGEASPPPDATLSGGGTLTTGSVPAGSAAGLAGLPASGGVPLSSGVVFQRPPNPNLLTLPPQQHAGAILAAFSEMSACSETVSRTPAGQITSSTFISAGNDPFLGQKLSDPRRADPAFLVQLVVNRNDSLICASNAISTVSALSPRLAVAVLDALVAGEELHIDLASDGITFGEANALFLPTMQQLEQEVAVVFGAIAQGAVTTPFEKQQAAAEARQAMQDFEELRQEFAGAYSAATGRPGSEIAPLGCVWSGPENVC
ncbi:MAG: hypothetical protein AAFV62_04580 [Pseudomonadota bacterium]